MHTSMEFLRTNKINDIDMKITGRATIPKPSGKLINFVDRSILVAYFYDGIIEDNTDSFPE